MEAKQVAISMLALAVLVACGQKQDDAAAMADHDTMVAAAPAPAAGPTDAQIAAIVVTANSGDSAAGMLAKAKSTNPKIRAFGQSMATDHGAVNGLAVSLAQKLNLTPESSPTSEALAQDGQQNLQKLEGLSGSAFDKAYIDHEVALHQQVLDALGSTLIPSAQNAELKALLEKGQPIFQGHLDMAKQVQASLSKS